MMLAARLAAAGLDWIVPDWDAPASVGALVTTRNGGVSRGAAASLDLGPSHLEKLASADRDAVLLNRQRVHAFLPAPPIYVEQVHGNTVAIVTQANAAAARAQPPIADALVTRAPGVPLAVRVADCLPVLLASDDGAVIGAAHAGWRGLAAGVLEATVAAMRVEGTRLTAWLGPAIGPQAFEVGDDVRDAFVRGDNGAANCFRRHGEHKWLADLPALARARLACCGVHSVRASGACTYSDPTRFHSWRRDRTPARLAAYIWRDRGGSLPTV